MRSLGISQRFYKFLRLKILRLIGWQAITEFSNERNTFIFWEKQSKENGCSDMV